MFSDNNQEEKLDIEIVPQLGGKPILHNDSHIDYQSMDNIPECKSNSVSFVKVEDLPYDCRNLLAVHDPYICYSVTQKKNLLRLIHTENSAKCILRGHLHPVLDLKFSIEPGVLCSVDNGDLTNHQQPKIIVWKKEQEITHDTDELNFKSIFEISIGATKVISHPSILNFWAITNKTSFAIFSNLGLLEKSNTIHSYNDIPLNATLKQNSIVDMDYLSDGTGLVLAVEIQSVGCVMQLWTMQSATGLILFATGLTIQNLRCIKCINNHMISVIDNNISSHSSNTIHYKIQVWKYATDIQSRKGTMDLLQTVTVTLPTFQSRLPVKQKNPLLECTLSSDSLAPKDSRYMLLSSRLSNLVVCFGVTPSAHSLLTTNPSLGGSLQRVLSGELNVKSGTIPLSRDGVNPLLFYHVTFLDMIAPIVSMNSLTAMGRVHHSAEVGVHVEMSCYQEEAARDQATIRQYHVLMDTLFNYSQYVQRCSKDYHALNSASQEKDLIAELNTPTHTLPLHENNYLELLSPQLDTPSMQKVEAAAGGFQSMQSHPLPTTTPEMKSRTIFNLLNTLNKQSNEKAVEMESKSKSSSGIDVDYEIVHPSGSYLDASFDAAAAGGRSKVLPITAVSTPPANGSDVVDMSSQSTASGYKVGRDVLKALTSSQSVDTTQSKGSQPSLSKMIAMNKGESTEIKPQPSILDKLNARRQNLEGSNSSAVTTKVAPAPSAGLDTPPSISINHIKDTMKNTNVADLSQSNSASSTPRPPSAASNSSSIELNGTPSHMINSLAEIKQVVRSLSKSNITKQHLTELRGELLSEFSAMLKRSNPSTVQGASIQQYIQETESKQGKFKMDVMESTKDVINQRMDDVLSDMRSHQELSIQSISTWLHNYMEDELMPKMMKQLKAEMEDVIKQQLHSILKATFYSAFENSLLPAFHAGTDKLFGQLQHGFEVGMESMVMEQKAIGSMQNTSTAVLQSEIVSLKETIQLLSDSARQLSLEIASHSHSLSVTDGKIQNVVKQLRQQSLHPSSNVAEEELNEVVVDPFVLLDQGLVSEAILKAVEDKDIGVTVSLLDRVTPQQVNAKCSNLIRLCITQQLAADMSVNIPEEGVGKRIEWIKSLVLSLINDPQANKDASFQKTFKAMSQVVLESIQSAKNLLLNNSKSSTGDGEDSDDYPISISNDLQLLEFVIRSKL